MATYNGHNEDASGNILLSIGNGMAATLETGTTASQAYTKGAYLYYNNRLCKVTAAIAKSATLTIGTNIAYTTLGAELTSHLRASNGNELYFDYKDGKPGYYPTASKTASQFVPFGGSDLPDTIELKSYAGMSGDHGANIDCNLTFPSQILYHYKYITVTSNQSGTITLKESNVSTKNQALTKDTKYEIAALTYTYTTPQFTKKVWIDGSGNIYILATFSMT